MSPCMGEGRIKSWVDLRKTNPNINLLITSAGATACINR